MKVTVRKIELFIYSMYKIEMGNILKLNNALRCSWEILTFSSNNFIDI